MGLSSLVCGTELCVSDMMRMRVLMVAAEGEDGDKGGIGILVEETSFRIAVLCNDDDEDEGSGFSEKDVFVGVDDDNVEVEALLLCC